MAKLTHKKEFGDFQTPQALADQVCRLLKRTGHAPAAIVEPTCGLGSLLLSALNTFPHSLAAMGLDINPAYLAEVREQLAGHRHRSKVQILQRSFFDVDWTLLTAALPDPLLFVGNPPWVTNAVLGGIASENLPKKSNLHRYQGLDALTGKSNFDISEWMLLQLMEVLRTRTGTIAVLCKTAVARRLLTRVWKTEMPLVQASLYGIDAAQHFHAAVDACLFVCDFGAKEPSMTAKVFSNLDADRPSSQLGWRRNRLVANVKAFDQWNHLATREASGRYVWRSGVKHDCSNVMELWEEAGTLWNKSGEPVEIEPIHVFPMLKSSEIARGQVRCPANRMIITQAKIRAETDPIREHAPKTWQYLLSHAEALDGRRSSIYRNMPRFSVFGVGEYTFAAHKVAISGFYKKLHFEVVGDYRQQPIVFDDTVYFLSCRSQAEAVLIAELLHSSVAQEFYSALLFWDAKRPITSEILRMLDLRRLAEHLGRLHELDRLGEGDFHADLD